MVVGTVFQIYFLIFASLFLEEYRHFFVDKFQPILVFKMHCALVSDFRHHQGIEDGNVDWIMLVWHVWCPGFPQHNNNNNKKIKETKFYMRIVNIVSYALF